MIPWVKVDTEKRHYSKKIGAIALGCLIAMLGGPVAQAQTLDAWVLQEAQNLEIIGQQAAENGHPVLLLLTQKHGGGTATLKQEAILPLVENGLIEGYAVMLEVTVDGRDPVVDFYGQTVPRQTLAEWYNVTKVPTLITLDPTGEEISERMETAGAYVYVPRRIEKMINQGLAAMGQQKRLSLYGDSS